MFRVSLPWLKLRPRHVNPTPPPLAKRPGYFTCINCKHGWKSNQVMVTRLTHKCYQGESCGQCGTTNRPYYIGYNEPSLFSTHQSPDSRRYGNGPGRMKRRLPGQRLQWSG